MSIWIMNDKERYHLRGPWQSIKMTTFIDRGCTLLKTNEI
jgi:hypothetical protein